jgi:hypothetical protein
MAAILAGGRFPAPKASITKPEMVAVRFLFAWPDEVTIRNGANRHRSYALAMQ